MANQWLTDYRRRTAAQARGRVLEVGCADCVTNRRLAAVDLQCKRQMICKYAILQML
jgi:hypothetical protein